MLAEYLQRLKAKRGYSWSELEKLSGIPEITIKKVVKGETETPRIDTVIAIVDALDGDLNGIINDTDINKKDIIPLIESYQHWLKDKNEQIKVLRKEKKVIVILLIILVCLMFSVLVADILIGSRGWILYK